MTYADVRVIGAHVRQPGTRALVSPPKTLTDTLYTRRRPPFR